MMMMGRNSIIGQSSTSPIHNTNTSNNIVGNMGKIRNNGSSGLGSQQTNEIFTCIAYCTDNQTLCAGTNQGNLYTWKRTANYGIDVPENSWQLNNISVVRGAIKQCYWGINEIAKPCIMVNCISNVYVLKVSIYLYFVMSNTILRLLLLLCSKKKGTTFNIMLSS